MSSFTQDVEQRQAVLCSGWCDVGIVAASVPGAAGQARAASSTTDIIDAAAHAPPPSSICRRLVRSDEVEQHAPEALERIAAVGNHHEVGLVEPAGQKKGKPGPDDVAGVGLADARLEAPCRRRAAPTLPLTGCRTLSTAPADGGSDRPPRWPASRSFRSCRLPGSCEKGERPLYRLYVDQRPKSARMRAPGKTGCKIITI
jgi:hypothetical protein